MKFKKILILLILFVVLICSAAYSKSHKEFSYHDLTIDGAIKMMKEKKVIILDVRTKMEYDSGHINGAVNVPLESIDSGFQELFKDKNAYYMVYCRSGSRSETASKKLAILGYKNIYDFGSIKNWKEKLAKD